MVRKPMGYCGPMGYGRKFSANQLGGQLKLWGKRGYGLIQVWVKRGLTVLPEASQAPFLLVLRWLYVFVVVIPVHVV